MTQKKLIIFSAPSGAGKSTIVQHLLNIPQYQLAFSISATSRAPRGTEQNGKEYYFLTVDEFKKHIENDDFLEWEEVYTNNFYGTLKSEVERLWNEGKNIIFDIDVAGGLKIKNLFPEQSLSIFVKPPSIEELEQRLRNRKTEAEEKIKMRLDKASKEIASAPFFDIILENKDLTSCLTEAENILNNFLSK